MTQAVALAWGLSSARGVAEATRQFVGRARFTGRPGVLALWARKGLGDVSFVASTRTAPFRPTWTIAAAKKRRALPVFPE